MVRFIVRCVACKYGFTDEIIGIGHIFHVKHVKTRLFRHAGQQKPVFERIGIKFGIHVLKKHLIIQEAINDTHKGTD